jgi:quinoprotein glucose dehydrogenase
MDAEAVITPSGLLCGGGGPYGRVVATNLNTGKQVWSVAHGELLPGINGSIGVGGPIVTAGGLVFVASTNDPYLRAYNSATGNETWRGRLPASANATPMTYVVGGRQYVVIAVGGKSFLPEGQSDTVIAFALPVMRAKGVATVPAGKHSH